ncbi:hypothetical protein [Bdellovibrio sp. KM01]|uniref:hypothetical protein n=1 Tax=Bdellovibrio sp. KM01 TaxID=2748865 RepID=UPI0015E901B7|nr:hypothetical protein [Bdellovibrio sp. KM01]QLY26772.1 hypothetical protein HW988_07160 [Bdellovibrio sp. KM01]
MKLLSQIIILIAIAVPAFALTTGETLPAFQIQNQFEEPAELNKETKWILFSSDMNAAKMLSEYLNENASKLDLTKTLIISDISKMPGLVSKMFAIPKMKKYNFKLALDKTGETTKEWPRKEGHLVIIKMSELKIESIEELNSKEAIATFFKEKIPAR